MGAAGSNRLTETGLSLGTPYYMSPEQATGDQAVGASTDTYALGSVLYEMLVGEPPYPGTTAQAVLGRIIAGEPVSAVKHRASIPANVDAAVRKALEKLPADRFTSAQEFVRALGDEHFRYGELAATGAGGVATGLWNRLTMAFAALAVAASIAVGWTIGRTSSADLGGATAVTRFTLPAPGGYENTVSNEVPSLAISPDSRTVVWRENGMLMRRHLDEDSAAPIPGTEGAEVPFFSPDGTWLAFLQANVFRRVSADRVATSFTDATIDWIHGADWGEDDAVVYGRNTFGIWRAPVGGGEPVQITDPSAYPDEQGHMWPQTLAGGSLLLYTALASSGKWHDAKVILENLETGERETVLRGASYTRYIPSGHIVYGRAEGVIQAMPFDLDTGEGGESAPVESGVFLGQFGASAAFTVSPSGTLVFVRGDNSQMHLLRWYDREGRPLGQLGEPMTVAWGLEFDPTSNRVAAALPNNQNDDIYLLEDGMVNPDRMSSSPGGDGWPVWSPDGTRLAWNHEVDTKSTVAVREVDGDGDPVVVYESDGGVWPRSWSPDGRWLVVSERIGPGQDLIALNMDDPGEVITVLGTPAEEWDGQISPDGSLLAFDSNEGGSFATHVTTFPQATEPIRVANVPAQHPRWSPTRNELYFWSDTTLMAARYRTEPRFTVESVNSLFSVPDYFTSIDPYYNVTPDGERFLIQVHNPEAAIREIQVV